MRILIFDLRTWKKLFLTIFSLKFFFCYYHLVLNYGWRRNSIFAIHLAFLVFSSSFFHLPLEGCLASHFWDYFLSCFQMLPGLRWGFSFNAAVSLPAYFVQSDFTVKQTLNHFYLLPVNWRGISFSPVTLKEVFPIMLQHTAVLSIAIT